ncbi:hypothetical protein L7F22_034035 [Adiantum nelumboides]|nr:hypothetical protein [Adiantum nelumboides]
MDGGYLDLPWMVSPVPSADVETQRFNFKLFSTRIMVERTFGRLKQMWGYLQQRIKQPDVGFLPKVITACCVLHNIWLKFGELETGEDIVGDDTATHVEEAAQLKANNTRDILMSYMRAGHMD